MLKAGFARTDITPPMGTELAGHNTDRFASGVIDPLLATAVAFDNGTKRTVVMSIDNIGINQIFMSKLRPAVAEAAGTETDAIFIACTHIHTGPGVASTVADEDSFENPEYGKWLIKRLADTAYMAVSDMAPAKLSYTRGTADGVAFIRRFRMKDGSIRTNPGYQNPDIDYCLSNPDNTSSLLIIKRENKPEIGIVNFQVHPDVLGGAVTEVSADYIKFVRDTYELLIPNSKCMYINGAQGDSNHVDVSCSLETDCVQGYERARYMGRKIAMSAIADYELAQEIDGDEIAFKSRTVTVKYNKGTQAELEWAREIVKTYEEKGLDAVLPGVRDMRVTETLGKARRVIAMASMPEDKELVVTAVSVGDVVFAGFPGEPFTEIGCTVKKNSPYTLTIPACCANGYEGYYPMKSAFDEGGYEVLTTRYAEGTAEKLIDASTQIMKEMKKQK